MSLTFAASFMCHTPLIISLANVSVCYNHIRVKVNKEWSVFRLLVAGVAIWVEWLWGLAFRYERWIEVGMFRRILAWGICCDRASWAKYEGGEKNQHDATIRCLLLTSVSTCFGHHYAHLQENKDPCYCIWCTALVLLDVVGSGCGASNCCILLVFFSLHTLLTMHGHKNLKKKVL